MVNQAHDGTWSRLPVSLELKAVGQGCWPGEAQLESWLDQAQRQAAGRPYRVVWKRHRQPTAAGLVIDRRRVAQPLGYWLEEQAADHAGRLLHTVAPPASGLELAPWAEVVELLDAAVAAAPWLEGWSA